MIPEELELLRKWAVWARGRRLESTLDRLLEETQKYVCVPHQTVFTDDLTYCSKCGMVWERGEWK